MQLVSTLLETYVKMKNPLSNLEMRVKPKTKNAKITKFSFAHLRCNVQWMMLGIWLKLKGVLTVLVACQCVS